MALRERLKKLRMERWVTANGRWWYVGLYTPWGVLRVSLQPEEKPQTPLNTWGNYGHVAK
jgi:hypothetical protein